MKKQFTIQKTSELLKDALIRGNSTRTVHRLIREGELRTNGEKDGRNTLVDASSVMDFILRAKRIPTADDQYLAFYVRTSSHRDPRGRVRIQAIRKLLKWAREISEEHGIHLCYSPNQQANNVRVYHDTMGINDDANVLPGFQRLCKDMSMKKPKMAHLFVYTMSRLVRGDSTYFRNLCKAHGVQFWCRDILGKREKEILKDDENRIARAQGQRDAAEYIGQGRRKKQAELDQRFAPLIDAARAKVKTADQSTLDRLRGLIIAYNNNDRSNGLERALKGVLGA